MNPPGSAPALVGISHLAWSVRDLDAAVDFWRGVMGFEVTTRTPTLCFLIDRVARLGIGLTDHGGTVTETFDERRTGLDHLALAVADVVTLDAWAGHLDARGVAHSGVIPTDAGWHLNLRAPDAFPVELFVISAEAADAFGLTGPESAVAHGPVPER